MIKVVIGKRFVLIRMVLCIALLTSCFDGEETKPSKKETKKNKNVVYWEDVVLEEETMVEETMTEETLNVTYW